MSIGSIFPIEGNIFERAYGVLSNPTELVEGIFWGSFLTLDAVFLRNAVVDLNQKKTLPETDPQKIDQVWRAKKDCLLLATSLASSSFMTIDWMNRTGIIFLGLLGPLAGGLGYGGRGLFSLLHLHETGGELIEKNSLYRKSQNDDESKALLKEQIRLLVKIATQVLMAVWGIFGMLYICTGGSLLMFYISDMAFLCWLLLFPFYVASEMNLRDKKVKELELSKANQKPLAIPLHNAIKA